MTLVHASVLVAIRIKPRTVADLVEHADDWVGSKVQTVPKTHVVSVLHSFHEWGWAQPIPCPWDDEQKAIAAHSLPYLNYWSINRKGDDALQEWLLYTARVMELHALGGGAPAHNRRARELVEKLGCKPWIDPRDESFLSG